MAVSRPWAPPFEICRSPAKFARAGWIGPATCRNSSPKAGFSRSWLTRITAARIHSPADVQIEFGRESVRIISLLGYTEQDYPRDWIVSFNRTDLEPPWGAWEPELLAIAVLALVAGLMLLWAALATIYFLPVRLISIFANRDLDFRGSWKLASAALMPGVLLMTAAIVLYDFAVLDLVQFCFIFAAHFALGWIYLFLSHLFLPRIGSALPKGNPFTVK